MKKITDFIVDKRYLILVLFITISLIALFISRNVVVNNDISSYLPEDSKTKIGIKIMDKNFDEIKSSNLYIMFEDLDSNEKLSMKEKLESIKDVDSVSYEDTRDYNHDNYTLYILNVEDYSDSKTSKRIYDTIKEDYKDYKYYLGGSIDNANKPIVQTWILISAVVFALIILIIMCESYIEPFLFLFVIGLAIFLNSGTNIIFDSVSSITSAISAILQLALSMDYSIILMNRYSQEREKNKDNKKAMKEALYHACKSITSSSVTTIVGLLALVFMSFTIGKDLGFVLAKGVLFSLISIFLCLPGLIILFDKLIIKTKKKSFTLKLDRLGKNIYKCRYICMGIFIILFVVSYILRGNLNYLFTGAEQDEIAKHFNTTNQIVIVYKNEYEKDIAELCRNIDNEKVDEVLCYGNTINEGLKYDEVNDKLSTLGDFDNIDEYLIKIVYYYYNNENINNKMTLNQFITFIENEVYKNENIDSKIDSDVKNNITKLKNFSNNKQIKTNRTYKDVSNILGLDETTTKNLYILYHKKDVNIKIPLDKFINFLNKDVLNNKTYSSSISKEQIEYIKIISLFINKDTINTDLNSDDLSVLFNMDKDSIDNLLMLYYSTNESGFKLSISEFLIGIDSIRPYLNDTDITPLETLITVSKNENNINNTKLNKAYLKAYFKGLESIVDLVYTSNGFTDDITMTPKEFLDIVLNNYSSYIPSNNLDNLKILSLVINDTQTDQKALYTSKEMANILGIPIDKVQGLYVLLSKNYGYELRLSPYKFVNLILTNKDNTLLKDKLDTDTLSKLTLLNTVMDSIINNKTYTYKEVSNLFNLNQDTTNLLYSLYDITYNNPNYKISLYNFVDFIVNDVSKDSKYKDSFNAESMNKLKNILKIMDGSINETKYKNTELYNLLKTLSQDLDKNMLDLVYVYYGSINDYDENYRLTIETLINFLNNKVIDNKMFKDYIDDDMKEDIRSSKTKSTDSKDLLIGSSYSRALLNTKFEKESDETFNFIDNIEKELDTKDKEIYVIGDSPMAKTMSQSFNSELNFITILTMVAIFVVVALTFKSAIVALILVLIIECAVFIVMGILSLTGSSIYFIAILIVQSILMGATIDYAIVYTSYYKEYRLSNMSVIDSIKSAYNNSIHTILTSASILIIVTLIVGLYAEAIAAKICITVSQGTLCSSILVLFILPGLLACLDKFIIKKK